MYAENDAGKLLQNSHFERRKSIMSKVNSRIVDWINKHYESLKRFCRIFDLNEQEWVNTLYTEDNPTIEMIYTLDDAGCNTAYIMDSKGSQYSNNKIGKQLQHIIIDAKGPALKEIKMRITKAINLYYEGIAIFLQAIQLRYR